MGNPLNRKVKCKECCISAKIRRFPYCSKNCDVWKWVQNEIASVNNKSNVEDISNEPSGNNQCSVNEHILAFDKLRKEIETTKIGFIESSDDNGSSK